VSTVACVVTESDNERRERERQGRVLAALAAAMREIIDRYGLDEANPARKATQQRAGVRVGISQRAISTILTGKGTPELWTLIKMRDALGRPLDELVGFSSPRSFDASADNARELAVIAERLKKLAGDSVRDYESPHQHRESSPPTLAAAERPRSTVRQKRR
jgi:transcriptional regulator with XRE-family HTH domain